MAGGQQDQREEDGPKPGNDGAAGEGGPGGNGIEEASDEAVRFLEQGDEPGHAGRGDGG